MNFNTPGGGVLKTCYLDHPDPQYKTSLFSIKATSDLSDCLNISKHWTPPPGSEQEIKTWWTTSGDKQAVAQLSHPDVNLLLYNR